MSKRGARRSRAERKQERERILANALRVPLHAGNGHAIDADTQTIERAQEIINRQSALESKQPRFSDASSVFSSIYNWVRINALANEPNERATIRQWDAWLPQFVLQEPYLAGVYNSVVQIDKNRGWKLIGGRNQVLKFSDVLHDADNGAGWRAYISWQSQSYYSTRAGFVTEVGSDGEFGPMRALWSVDSARVELTGNEEFPLDYFPPKGGKQQWSESDYFRAASLTSIDEAKRGYGYPANARCFDLAKIMVAVWEHDKEQLAARAPRGLLLLKGITEDQWIDAMQAREESLNANAAKYYGKIAVLASSGVEDINAQLFALSSLPKDFNLREWVSLLIYGYALAYGYDAREFFPVDSGDLGSATETEVQHQKATSKGDLDFSLAHQEQMQNRLPETLQFEYEQRDASGESLDATIALQKAQVISEMARWTLNGQAVLSREQIFQLAVENGVIPEDWTPEEEDVAVTDIDDDVDEDTNPETDTVTPDEDEEGKTEPTDELERVMSLRKIQRALEMFPNEPIVEYSSRTDKIRTIYTPRARLLHTLSDEQSKVFRTVTKERDAFCRALNSSIKNYWRTGSGDIGARIRDLVTEYVDRAYVEGLREGGVTASEITEEDAATIDRLIFEQTSRVDGFADAIQEARKTKELRAGIETRADLWCQSIEAAGVHGVNSSKANEMVEFAGISGDESCKTCNRLLHQRHRRSWFEQRGLVPEPGNENFECRNFNCEHKLKPIR